MGLDLDASAEELKLFLEEAEEHLQTLEEDLIRMEKEKLNEDLLQEIFRASHTLKGSSATIGHVRMAELTHGMENILDKLRKKQISVTSELVDILFESLDCLRVLRDEMINDEVSDLDLGDVLQKMASFHEETEGAAGLSAEEPAVAAGASSAPRDISASAAESIEMAIKLSWEEKDIVHQAQSEGLRPYLIKILLDVEPEMWAVRAYVTVMACNEIGEIVKSDPAVEEIEKEKLSDALTMLILTRQNKDEIGRLIGSLPNISKYDIQEYTEESADSITSQEESPTGALNVPAKSGSPTALQTAEPKTGGKGPGGGGGVKKINRTVRVDVDLLDSLMNLVGELVIDRTRLFQILSTLEVHHEMDDISQDLSRTSVHIARVTTQLQEHIMKARMLPVENLFNKFPRMIRDLSQKAGKEVDFVMTGQETELDRSIIEEIGDPLIHLLRNGVDHGLELPEERAASGKDRVGQLKLQAAHEENHIIITIKDDGKGIDPEKVKASAAKKGLITEEQAKRLTDKEAVNLIFVSGLSTASQVTDVSGRGVGMDVVRNNIEKINGAIEINSAVGQGTEFRIKLPLTLAIIRALLVNVGKSIYAIPLSNVTETIRIQHSQIGYVNNHEVIVVRGKTLPLIRLRKVFGRNAGGQADQEKLFIVVVNLAGQQVGLVVDSLVGEQEIVIKSLGKFIGDLHGISGATILGDGNVALIVDVSNLIKKAAS